MEKIFEYFESAKKSKGDNESNKLVSLSSVRPITAHQVLSINIILNEFIQYLPIYTLSNLIRSFPDYTYTELPIMKKVCAYESALDYSTFKLSYHGGLRITTIESNDAGKVVEVAEINCGMVSQRTTSHETKVYDAAQLIQVFTGSQSEYNAVEKVNEMIQRVDSIGLGDLLNLKANYDSKATEEYREQSQTWKTAFVCSGFLKILLPLDNKMEHTVYRSYEYTRCYGGASRSDDDIDETWNFAYQYAPGIVRKLWTSCSY